MCNESMDVNPWEANCHWSMQGSSHLLSTQEFIMQWMKKMYEKLSQQNIKWQKEYKEIISDHR